MRALNVALASACLTALACSTEPLFTDEPAPGGSGGESATGASGGAGANGTGGDGAGTVGGSSTGGGPSGGGPTGGGGTGGTPAPFCGDGIINGADECDDGNPADDDGCTGCVVDCPDQGIKDPATNHCYFPLEGFSAPWQTAVDECALSSAGTTLAVLATVQEFDFVVDHFDISSSYWLGGNDLNVQGTYEWITGEPWVYVDNQYPWDPSQPADYGGQPDDCLAIDDVFGPEAMYDRVCADNYGALCERTPVGQ